jgi:uncharacterized protein (TIGR02285 family)
VCRHEILDSAKSIFRSFGRNISSQCWLVLLLNAGSAFGADNHIVWLVEDEPPLFILKGSVAPNAVSQLGKGIIDREMAEIIARLPRYQHSFERANTQRIWAGFGAGKNRCSASVFRTAEREKLAYFTAISFVPAITLVVRRDRMAAIHSVLGSVSLKNLVAGRHDLIGFIQAIRSYGTTLDDTLSHADTNVQRVTVSESGQLLRMLDAGRMDYTLEYPMIVEYQRQLAPFKNSLETLTIDEAPPLATGYVACTRNDWGKQVIHDIELAVQDAAHSPSYRSAVTDWMPVSLVKTLQAKIDAFYDDLANHQQSGQ